MLCRFSRISHWRIYLKSLMSLSKLMIRPILRLWTYASKSNIRISIFFLKQLIVFFSLDSLTWSIKTNKIFTIFKFKDECFLMTTSFMIWCFPIWDRSSCEVSLYIYTVFWQLQLFSFSVRYFMRIQIDFNRLVLDPSNEIIDALIVIV